MCAANWQCASGSAVKNSSEDPNKSNVLLNVSVMIPEHEDNQSKSREPEDTAEIELNGCLSGTGVRACMDEVLAGRQNRRLPERSKFVANNQ